MILNIFLLVHKSDTRFRFSVRDDTLLYGKVVVQFGEEVGNDSPVCISILRKKVKFNRSVAVNSIKEFFCFSGGTWFVRV
jgi:hypothetical protein